MSRPLFLVWLGAAGVFLCCPDRLRPAPAVVKVTQVCEAELLIHWVGPHFQRIHFPRRGLVLVLTFQKGEPRQGLSVNLRTREFCQSGGDSLLAAVRSSRSLPVSFPGLLLARATVLSRGGPVAPRRQAEITIPPPSGRKGEPVRIRAEADPGIRLPVAVAARSLLSMSDGGATFCLLEAFRIAPGAPMAVLTTSRVEAGDLAPADLEPPRGGSARESHEEVFRGGRTGASPPPAEDRGEVPEPARQRMDAAAEEWWAPAAGDGKVTPEHLERYDRFLKQMEDAEKSGLSPEEALKSIKTVEP